MIFDPVPEYFYRQSGVIPYRIRNGELQVLLITSRKSGKWIIPKGVVEPYMTPQESAAQEAYEEAGIFGRVADNPMGNYQMKKWNGVCTVMVYPMLVLKEYDDWMEKGLRKRKWMSAEQAAEKAGRKDVRKLLVKFAEIFSIKNTSG